jgi:hypothetical protein
LGSLTFSSTRSNFDQELETAAPGEDLGQPAGLGQRYSWRTDVGCDPQDHDLALQTHPAGRNQGQTTEAADPSISRCPAIHRLSIRRGRLTIKFMLRFAIKDLHPCRLSCVCVSQRLGE